MTAPNWEVIAGRCGACRRFERDFGAGEGKVYGHCPPKPRRGSISSADFKCDSYEPIDALAPARPLARARPAVSPFEVTVKTPHKPPPEPPKTRRSPGRQKPAVVVRKPSREERDAEPVRLLLSDAPPTAGQEPSEQQPEGDTMDRATLRRIIQEAIEDSLGIGEAELLDRFKGGTVTIEPGHAGSQPKTIPIDALMRKIVMVRDNLRVLEQKVNGHPKLDDADRIALQQYITRCYGSLTTFNMLFKYRDDGFKGSGR